MAGNLFIWHFDEFNLILFMANSIRQKQGPSFIIKGLTFFIILFFLDYSIGNLLRYFYFKQDSGLLYRTTYALDSTKADILIFGSSTANHHYIPALFTQGLHMSCYNTGRDGNNILYSYAILQGVLRRHPPKMIILDIYNREFRQGQDTYDRITSLLPYYEKHPEIRPIIQLKSSYEKYKFLSKIYPFNSLVFTIAVGNADFNKKRESINDQNGYIPMWGTWQKQLSFDTSYPSYNLDNIKINVLKSFISDCQNSNIKLYLATSPKFIKYKYHDPTIEVVKTIAAQYNIPFYNFTNDSIFLNHRNFYSNRDHLNESGAEIFTNQIISRIKDEQ
jgi:hypothetical protein